VAKAKEFALFRMEVPYLYLSWTVTLAYITFHLVPLVVNMFGACSTCCSTIDDATSDSDDRPSAYEDEFAITTSPLKHEEANSLAFDEAELTAVESTRFSPSKMNSRYKGDIVEGKKEGFGKYVYVNGATYEGEWKDGKRHGKGIFIPADGGDVYDGQWKNGKREGKGRFKFQNGDEFEGDYVNDRREGMGVYRYSNPHDVYEGEFKNDLKHGVGIFKWSNGDEYSGEWKEGEVDGKGLMKYSNGNSYDGEFKGGKKNGKGTMKFANGHFVEYIGDFLNGYFEGNGSLRYRNGDLYTGQFKKDMREGEGKLDIMHEKKLRASYEGSFKHDKMHGVGIRKDDRGIVVKRGTWENNEFKKSSIR